MSEIDQQFIEYVVKSLVGNPDAVQIKRTIDEKGVLLELTVDPEDLGRVIGKRGATAQSLRTLLRALGTKNDARYNLKIIDNGTGAPGGGDDSGDKPAAKEDSKPEETKEAEQPEEPRTEEPKAREPQEEPAAANDEENTSDRLAKAREELADLDDLDV
jgi:predicted RNA-binding protein YlqC (UPF0109 family)